MVCWYPKDKFPSPCGDYGSYPLKSMWYISCGKKKGFRPLAGIMVLIFRWTSLNLKCSTSFRPLAGIMVLIVHRRAARKWLLEKFPSPCGDYGSYRTASRHYWLYDGTVSVPLRGLWFLSGECFFVCGRCLVVFPSPCGDYGSYRPVPTAGISRSSSGFRPLAGIMVLIKAITMEERLQKAEFPSPCGDYGSYHLLTSAGIPPGIGKFPSPCGDYGSYLERNFNGGQ